MREERTPFGVCLQVVDDGLFIVAQGRYLAGSCSCKQPLTWLELHTKEEVQKLTGGVGLPSLGRSAWGSAIWHRLSGRQS